MGKVELQRGINEEDTGNVKLQRSATLKVRGGGR